MNNGLLPLAAVVYAVGIGGAIGLDNIGRSVGSVTWLAVALCAGGLILTSNRWGIPPVRSRRGLALLCLACLGGCGADLQREAWLRWVNTLKSMGTIEAHGRLVGEFGHWQVKPDRICTVIASEPRCVSGRSLPLLIWKNASRNKQDQPLEPGVVVVRGEFSEPNRPNNPGEYDALANARQTGAAGEVLVTAWRQESVRQDRWSLVRKRWEDAIGMAVPGEAGDLLKGMILGGSGQLSATTRNNLNKAGLAHVTSVSGLHVAVVAGFLWFVFRSRSGWRGWAGVLAGALFVLLSGGKPPALRALIGLVVTMLAASCGRRSDPWTGLAVAWLALLALNPALLTNVGFALSFSSVAGILVVARPLLRSSSRRMNLLQRGRNYVQNSLAVSLGAQAGSAFSTVQAFGSLPTFGLVANLAGLPLATAALMVGLVGLLCYSAADSLGVGRLAIGAEYLGFELLRVAGWSADAFLAVCAVVAGSPWSSVEVPELSPLAGGAWLCSLVALSLFLQRQKLPLVVQRAGDHEYVWLILALLGILGCLAAPTWWQLRVTFLAVGQGDAILIQTPAGAVLVDAGGAGTGWDASRTIIPQLRRRGIKRLALVVSTHPHADHLGGMAGVLRARRVDSVVDNGTATTSNTYRAYRQALYEQSVRHQVVRAGDTLSLGGVQIRVLWPPASNQSVVNPSVDVNASSIVLLVSYGGVSVLLTGDVTTEAQDVLLQQRFPLQAVLWKASHQGAVSSYNPKFVTAVSPQVSVVSVGPNQYGHPSPIVISELEKHGIVCRTDKDGAVEFVTDGNRWHVRSMRGKECALSGSARM